MFTHVESPLDADQFATLQAIEYCSIVVPTPELGAIRYFGVWCMPYVSLDAKGVASLTERGADKLKRHKEMTAQKEKYNNERLQLLIRCDDALTAMTHAIGQLVQKGKGSPSRQTILNDLRGAVERLMK